MSRLVVSKGGSSNKDKLEQSGSTLSTAGLSWGSSMDLNLSGHLSKSSIPMEHAACQSPEKWQEATSMARAIREKHDEEKMLIRKSQQDKPRRTSLRRGNELERSPHTPRRRQSENIRMPKRTRSVEETPTRQRRESHSRSDKRYSTQQEHIEATGLPKRIESTGGHRRSSMKSARSSSRRRASTLQAKARAEDLQTIWKRATVLQKSTASKTTAAARNLSLTSSVEKPTTREYNLEQLFVMPPAS